MGALRARRRHHGESHAAMGDEEASRRWRPLFGFLKPHCGEAVRFGRGRSSILTAWLSAETDQSRHCRWQLEG